MGGKKKIDTSYKKESEKASGSNVAGMFKQVPAVLFSYKFEELIDVSSTRIRGKEKLGMRMTDSFNKFDIIMDIENEENKIVGLVVVEACSSKVERMTNWIPDAMSSFDRNGQQVVSGQLR